MMARPQKTGMDYFPHDVDAQHDQRLQAMQQIFGNDGYAFYFKLLEIIYRSSPRGKRAEYCGIDLSKRAVRLAVCRNVGVDEERFAAMVEAALDFGLFEAAVYERAQVLTSKRVRETMAGVEKARQKWRKLSAQKTRGKPLENSEKTRGKPHKEKKRKEKNITPLTPLEKGGGGERISKLYQETSS